MTTELTTKQLILNLEKITSPAVIAIVASLNARQLDHIDLWVSGKKELTALQFNKLNFAWSVLKTMANINGKKPTEKWFQTISIPIERGNKIHMVSPAKAISLKEYEAVLGALGPL